MPQLRCQIVRWLCSDPFPGWVEAELVDRHGRVWRFHDKPPVFGADANEHTPLPVDGVIACEVITAHGGNLTVDTTLPWGIEATDGTTRFDVAAEQLIEADAVRFPCPTCGGTGVDLDALRKKRNSARIARAHFDDPPCPDCLGSGELEAPRQ